MPRQQQGRYSPERSRRRESQRSHSREGEFEEREFQQDERGRYRSSPEQGDAGYGSEWPESYRSELSGEAPQRYRDSWSERQSGPYRSSVSGRPLSEDDYRQEARYYRSSPYTGFSGRVSEFGYEDPSWGVPQMGRAGAASGLRYGRPGEGYRGKGPRNYARSDERIKEDICDELSDDSECDASNVELDVTDGKVTLSGSVPERYMKHRAEDIADDCRGVKDVDNRIRVHRREAEEQRTPEEGRFAQPEGGEEASRSGKRSM